MSEILMNPFVWFIGVMFILIAVCLLTQKEDEP